MQHLSTLHDSGQDMANFWYFSVYQTGESLAWKLLKREPDPCTLKRVILAGETIFLRGLLTPGKAVHRRSLMLGSTLHIHLLGDFLLSSDETPVTAVTIPRVQSLLAYLVLHRAAPQDRSHLAFLLWPDSTEAQAHTNLRKALYHLRQSLPYANHFVFADKQSLHWHPAPEVAFSLDVEEFEQALAKAEQADQVQDLAGVRQALEQAIHLYRGDLFPSCYEEWIFPERDRFHQLFLQAAQRLLEIL